MQNVSIIRVLYDNLAVTSQVLHVKCHSMLIKISQVVVFDTSKIIEGGCNRLYPKVRLEEFFEPC